MDRIIVSAIRGLQPVRGTALTVAPDPLCSLVCPPVLALCPHFVLLFCLRGSHRSSPLNRTLPFTPSGSLLCFAVHLTLRILHKLKHL